MISHNHDSSVEDQNVSVKLLFQRISVSNPHSLYKLSSQWNNDATDRVHIFAAISIDSTNFSMRTESKSVLTSEHTVLQWELCTPTNTLSINGKHEEKKESENGWSTNITINELKEAKLSLSFHSTPNNETQTYKNEEIFSAPIDHRTYVAIQKIQAQARGYLSR